MKRVRFTEEQIIAVLREHEAGAKTADLARKKPQIRIECLGRTLTPRGGKTQWQVTDSKTGGWGFESLHSCQAGRQRTGDGGRTLRRP